MWLSGEAPPGSIPKQQPKNKSLCMNVVGKKYIVLIKSLNSYANTISRILHQTSGFIFLIIIFFSLVPPDSTWVPGC